jgi:hypothetical protein
MATHQGRIEMQPEQKAAARLYRHMEVPLERGRGLHYQTYSGNRKMPLRKELEDAGLFSAELIMQPNSNSRAVALLKFAT